MTMRSPFTCVLWDVDGTLVDASDGILRRLTTALEHFGKPAPTRDELVHWIGPPMFNSFQDNVGMTPEQATEAVAYYRTLGKADGYTTGARLYPGVAEIIADLDTARIAQATASSKPEVQVVALMEHFDLAPHMTAMVGSTPTRRRSHRSPTSSPRPCAACVRPESTRAVRCSSATATTTSRAVPRRGAGDLRAVGLQLAPRGRWRVGRRGKCGAAAGTAAHR
jgi:phosphoglycolate phosphatase-like HAD superfamily hydrolase